MALLPGIPLNVVIGLAVASGLFFGGFGLGYKVRDGAAVRERAAAVEAQLDETLKEVERGNELAFQACEY